MHFIKAAADALAGLYGLGLVFSFTDFVGWRRRLNRVALLALLWIDAVITVAIGLVLLRLGTTPIYVRFYLALIFSWGIVLLAGWFDRRMGIRLTLLFACALSFLIAACDLFPGTLEFSTLHQAGDILAFHIVSAALSYLSFAVAFLFSVMYLIQELLLRRKQWNRWYLHLTALRTLELYSLRLVALGVPLLFVSMAFGFIWSKVHLGTFLLADPKTLGTVVSWALYVGCLVLYVRRPWGGRGLAVYNLICFLGLVINFTWVGSFSVFHSGL